MNTLRLTDVDRQPPARPQPGERVTIGVDLARNKWAHAVYWGDAVHRGLATPGTLEHLQQLVREYHPAHPVRVVYEACGFGYEVAWWAQSIGVEVVVVAPSRVERVPGARVKTDRLDAATLASKGARGLLTGLAIPTRTQHERRQLLPTHRQVCRERARLQTRRPVKCPHPRSRSMPRAP